MKTELKIIAVLQAGKVFAALYTIIAVVTLPVALIALVAGPKGAAGALPILSTVILYPVVGSISGVIFAALYNLAAKWVGGIRFTLEQSE